MSPTTIVPTHNLNFGSKGIAWLTNNLADKRKDNLGDVFQSHMFWIAHELETRLVALHPPHCNGVEHFFWWNKEMEFP